MVEIGKKVGSYLGLPKGQTRRFAGIAGGMIAVATLVASMLITPAAAAEPTLSEQLPVNDEMLLAGSSYVAGKAGFEEQPLLLEDTAVGALGQLVDTGREFRLKDDVLNWLEIRSSAAAGVGQLLLARTDSGFRLDLDVDEFRLDWQMRF